MPTFKDANGKEWLVSLDAPTVRTIRNECDGLDLLDLDGKAYDQMISDPCLLVETLWIICREQGIAANVNYETFAKGLKGDALDGATAAMLESIADFFPKTKRKLVTTVAHKNAKLRNLAMERVLKKIEDPELERRALEALDTQMDAQIESALTSSSSATSTRVSAESRPKD